VLEVGSRGDALLAALLAVKNTPRTGWMLRGVPAAIAETIAAHMAESAILALVIADGLRMRGIDISPEESAAIALVHDVSEGFLGDIVKRAVDEIGREAKERAELRVASQEFGEDSILYNLLKHYVEQDSAEALVAKVAEQLSTMLQALRYRQDGYPVEEILCNIYGAVKRTVQADEALRVALENVLEDLFGKAFRETDKACKTYKKDRE